MCSIIQSGKTDNEIKSALGAKKDNWENRRGSDVLNFFFIGYIFSTLIFRKGFSGEVTIKSSDVNLKARSQLSDIYRQEHLGGRSRRTKGWKAEVLLACLKKSQERK